MARRIPPTRSLSLIHILKAQGKIRAIGASNMTADLIRGYCQYGELDVIQEKYSLLTRRVEKQLLPTCKELGLSLIHILYVNLYRRGDGGVCIGSLPLEKRGQGLWSVYFPGDQHGRYYTYPPVSYTHLDVYKRQGPCSIEGEEQALRIAQSVKAGGATLFRGGAYKPRTSPYSFQGLETEGILDMVKAREATGMPIVSELMSEDRIPEFEEYVDCLLYTS